MKKGIFRSAETFVRAFPHFMAFELMYKLLLVTISAPIMMLLLKLTMKLSHISYISDEHILVYLRNPATGAAVVLVLLSAAASEFIELSALTACFSCCTDGRRLGAWGMLRAGFRGLRKAIRSGSWDFIKFALLMPLTQFTLSAGVFTLPLFPMIKTAMKRMNGAFAIGVYTLIQVVFVFLIIDYCYSLHFLILTDMPFSECTKASKQLVAGKKLRSAAAVLVRFLFIFGVSALLTFSVSFVILLFIKGFGSPGKAFFASLRVMRYAWEIFAAMFSFIAAPAIMCSLTGRFFSSGAASAELHFPDFSGRRLNRPAKLVIVSGITAAAVGLNFSYITAVYKGNISLNVGILSRTQITAHRGFSAVAPENTLHAFRAALDSGADYIELDVQRTKDGKLVVFHDDKLDRTTDGHGQLSRHTYDELCRLSAAYRFADDPEFADARIPLLSEVLDEVGGEILLNIEIKNVGTAAKAAEQTVELIKEYGLEDSCYITSFSYNILKRVKSLDPDIKTGLIANSAATAFVRIKDIDALSMNHLLVTPSVVNTAHTNGKRIFVWTVDNTSDMKNMIATGVDNIITNRPDKAAELVYSKSVSSRILTILKALFS